jgi:predicted LPLAT superfamily acyltransferase
VNAPCIVIPVFNHGAQIGATLARLLPHGLPVILVDDGSDAPTRDTLAALAARHAPQVTLIRLACNGGKGAAVMAGLRAARDAGYSHALQIDADGQHDAADVPRFVDVMHASPAALILGQPVYDDSVPAARRYGRWFTHLWVWIETLSLEIRDAMCGFRMYPLAPVCALLDAARLGTRMDFDIEVLVRLHWMGLRVVTIPTRVIYGEDGVSHFDVWRDNLRISGMHARLFAGMLWRAPSLLARRRRGGAEDAAWWRKAERGSALGIALLAWCARVFGTRVTSLVLHPVVAYFVLTSRAARTASAGYLRRLARSAPDLDLPAPGWRSAYRHVFAFARAGLDKLVAWNGRVTRDTLAIDGRDVYEEILRERKGALLIGSHLGNLEMLRALASDAIRTRITAVVYTRHARRFNARLAHESADFRIGMLEVSDIGPDTALMMKQRIDAGELLVIVGDRVPVDSARTVDARFLGDAARFSQGPYLLAHLLECPVYLLFCIAERGRYTLSLERFAARIALPRRTRQDAIARHAQRYAERLEHHCRRAPLQWFNFYDFWSRRAPEDHAHD